MPKTPIKTIASGYYSTDDLNQNFTALQTAIDNTLSRDGTSPNQVLADVDMNSKEFLNLKEGTTNASSTTVGQVTRMIDQSKVETVDGIVDNINVLKSLPVPNSFVVYNVMGYYTPGDGGGGQFYWDATSVASDNGGTVILPTGYTGTGRWVRNCSGAVNVRWFGAKGDGIADDTSAIQTAVNVVTVGGTVLFPPATYLISSIEVTGKSVVMSGHGATLKSTGANGGIYKTDHGNKLIVEGLAFLGAGAGIKHVTTASTSVYDELDIISCTFNMESGVYGIFSSGGREPRIQNCLFRNVYSGNGVYFKDTVSPFLNTCIFKGGGYVGRAIYYPGTGNGTDAGLVLRDCEVMGWDKGVEVVGCDWLVIDGCTIDYNNQSIKLGSQDRANISNNYIGSLGANPALWITYDPAGVSPNYSEKIFVTHNVFTGHYTTDNTYDCILVDGANSPDSVVIVNNSIGFYTRYGINFSLNSSRLIVTGNTFAQRTGFGVAPIFNSLGATDSGVIINGNYFSNQPTVSDMNVTALCRVNENMGCITEARSEVVAGTGVTSIVVDHGLSYTPSKSDIVLSATNLEAAKKGPYISAVDATNITIGFTVATEGPAGVVWRVRRGPV